MIFISVIIKNKFIILFIIKTQIQQFSDIFWRESIEQGDYKGVEKDSRLIKKESETRTKIEILKRKNHGVKTKCLQCQGRSRYTSLIHYCTIGFGLQWFRLMNGLRMSIIS